MEVQYLLINPHEDKYILKINYYIENCFSWLMGITGVWLPLR